MDAQVAPSVRQRQDATEKGTGVTLCDLPDCINDRPAGVDQFGIFIPDGRGLAYIPRNDPNNVWVQPLGGGTAREITSE